MMDASTILHCKDRLEEQLQKARDSLRGVDDNLKKFSLRSVSDAPLRTNFNKTSQASEKWKTPRDENFSNNFRRRPARVLGENDVENIPIKKRLGPKILHSSISGPPKRIDDYNDAPAKKPTVSSCVVAKPLVVPSRKEALSVKTYTETRARDRRMFGALIGTLQKFRQEETQMKDKEDKKAQVEKKLEEAAKREKEKIRLEKQKLMDIRKQRESYIKAVENNMKLVKEQEQWEELQLPLFNYIRTETKPVIYYLPKVHNEKTTKLLEEWKSKLTKLIEEKRQSVKEEVDSLISQWQNVNVQELTNKDIESPARNNENNNDSPSHDDADKDVSASGTDLQPSSLATVTNGSWSVDDNPSATWRSDDHTVQYSAKEQRIRKRSTDPISVKQEKEDDYELKSSTVRESSPGPKSVAVDQDSNPVQQDDDKSSSKSDEREEESRESGTPPDAENEVPAAENE